ncbi:hypothetical protein F8566_27290 [Actinomadura rudentiformis]|uniref:Uncharacterized protein n=2 Tax=Actinomadura rudentiformis TaxID=359158 RepID=A0A6H9YVW0_9ACTN|nr:hypothetical protein F8566_27290 [Actinomadura rudentiformis]
MVSALSLSVVSCSSDDDDAITAYCVTQDDGTSLGTPAPFPTEGPDGYRVVGEYNCDDPDAGRSSHASYFWYYGGVRNASGRVSAGSTVMPSSTNITSAEGKTIRSGFGSSSSGSSGG